MKKLLIQIVIIVLIVLSLVFLVAANTQNIYAQSDKDIYLDKYANEEVTIIEQKTYYRIESSTTGETLFLSWKTDETVYCTADGLNIRTIPTVQSERYGLIYENTAVHRVGKSNNNWDLLEIDGSLYFAWSEYLTTEAPENPIALDYWYPEEIILDEEWFEIDDPLYINDMVWEEPIAEPEPALCYLGAYAVTFYCKCEQCCGVWSQYPGCASGVIPTPWYTCACGPSIPFGTTLYIDGLGYFVCEDRGVPDGMIDIFVNNHGEMPAWGLDYFDIYIVY